MPMSSERPGAGNATKEKSKDPSIPSPAMPHQPLRTGTQLFRDEKENQLKIA